MTADAPAGDGSDFGRSFWRSAPAAAALPPLTAGSIDDATFRLLADNLPVLCWVANGDGYIVWYNRRWHDYCGTRPEQMEGWGWQAVHDPVQLPGVMERWTAAVASGQPFEMLFPLRGADGVFRPFLTRAQPVRNADGTPVRWFGVNTEVADQVAAEAALRLERDRNRDVLEGMDEGFVLLDDQFRVVQLNAEALRLEQRDAAEIVGLTHWEAWPGTQSSELGRLYTHAMATREAVSLEHRYTYPDGRARWIEMRGYPSGRGLALFYRDVTDRKESEAVTAESEVRFRTMADQAPVMIWVTTAAGECTYLNRRWYEYTGQADGTGEGYGWLDAVHPDDRPVAQEAFVTANAQERDYRVEFRLRRADGIYRWTLDAAAARFAADGAYLGYVGSVIDIDDRRETEFALQETTARAAEIAAEQAAILGQLAEGVIVTDRSGRITFVNEAAARIHGVARLDVEPGDYTDSYHLLTLDGDPYPPDRLPLARAVRLAETVTDSRWRIRRPDGSEVLAIGSARPVRDPAGTPIGAVLTLRDDTEREAAEVMLRDLNRDLERRVEERTQERDRLWRNTQDMQVVIDRCGVFQAVNPAATAVLGWTPEEMIGRALFDFVLPDDAAATRDALHHATHGALPTFENRYRHKDGGVRCISWVAAPEGESIYASGRNVTADKEREAELELAREALRQSQKMEAVGQLTGGIAHDFNNMLAVVIGSLDLLGRRLDTDDARTRRYVDAAADGARRAALLTQRLLAFSRQQPLKPEPIDPARLVTGMSDLIRGSLGSDVRLECVVAAGGWRAHVDPNQLENVVLNLAVNARDAMPDGGRLTIETQNADIDTRYAAANLGVPAGQYVLIAVTDTGAGMSADVIARAFDPFFTTKEVGKGTGLGLSQVYGFVKQSGGHVKIYSEPGRGTTVKVYLPRLLGADRDDPAAVRSTPLPTGDRQEVVLVVEDEPAVRRFTIDALGELGYPVIEADGAAAALALLDAHPEIMLLFTDVVMPDINGRKLADQALRRRPDLKILFTTGYTRNAVVHNGVLDAGVHLIGKPFTVSELAGKLRDVLDAAPTG